MEKFYIIYKTTNLINNKIYIGAHETSNIEDSYLGSGELVLLAIKKYGRNNFIREIISFHASRDEMYEEESVIVNENFIKRTDTYNIKTGGAGNFPFINSKGLNTQNLKIATNKHVTLLNTDENYRIKALEHLANVGRSYKFKPGSVLSDEFRDKISKAKKGKTLGVNNSQFGTCWITNGESNKKILKSDLTIWLESGWIAGRTLKFRSLI